MSKPFIRARNTNRFASSEDDEVSGIDFHFSIRIHSLQKVLPALKQMATIIVTAYLTARLMTG